jgi:hypothetical protein
VVFSATNEGRGVHELEVVRTDTASDDLPVEDERANVDEVGERDRGRSRASREEQGLEGLIPAREVRPHLQFPGALRVRHAQRLHRPVTV